MNPIIYNLSVNSSSISKITSLFIGVVLSEPIGIYFFMVSIFSEIFNFGIKNIIKQARPKGAKNCSGYVTFNKTSKSFGMPSGHSESIGLFTSFWLLYLWDKYKEENNISILNIIAIFLILLISLYVPYSRILIGCHSVSQVIVGYIIGIILGTISYKLYKSHFEEEFNKLK